MASEDIQVVAEKPQLTVVRKLLQVKLVDGKPLLHEGHIILVGDNGAEYLLRAKTT